VRLALLEARVRLLSWIAKGVVGFLLSEVVVAVVVAYFFKGK
jgi:hypothetical protein